VQASETRDELSRTCARPGPAKPADEVHAAGGERWMLTNFPLG